MDSMKLRHCENLIRYKFSNKLLLLEALNSANLPVVYENSILTVPRNDALAVLGDAHLAAILCNWWRSKGDCIKGMSITSFSCFMRKSADSVGDWDTLRKDQLNNAPLSVIGRNARINQCIIKSPGTKMVTDRMVATAVEAIAGAVYLDGGEAALTTLMRHLDLDQHSLLW